MMSYAEQQQSRSSRAILGRWVFAWLLCCIAINSGNAVAQVVLPGAGLINTVAGNGTTGYSGDGGAATSAELNTPDGVAVDAAGNIYVADTANCRIRKVAAATSTISTVAGNGTCGYAGDGKAATSAELFEPSGVAVDSASNVYIADWDNSRIRKITVSTGIISTVAGNGARGYSGDGGKATSAKLSSPYGVAIDSSGNIYIADVGNYRIRKVTVSTGIISTVAGNGTQGYSGDGGPATGAEMQGPTGVAVDTAGNIYIADSYGNRIRKVTASTGIISTVAGNGNIGHSGDGGPATSGQLYYPYGVAVDTASNIYIADNDNYRIRKITASTGIISTVAGNGTCGYSGNGGTATSAELCLGLGGVAVDTAGNVYIADQYNERTRAVGPVKAAPTITWATPTPIGYGTVLSATQLDASTTVAGTFTYSPPSGTLLNAGSQTLSVTFTPTDRIDYSTATATVTLTVAPAIPTITWAPTAAITYGTALSGTQLDATASVAGTFVYSPAAGTLLGAGTQTLSVTFTPTNTNYAIATDIVSLTVNKAPLTVTANNATRVYGAANPTFSDAFTGFMNGDTQSVVSGAASLTTTATTTSAVGTYPITAALGTLSAANYTFATFVNGTLAITQTTPTITWAPPAAITYGTALGGTQLDATASVAGTFVYSPPAGTVPAVGTQTLNVTLTPTDTTDYTAATGAVSLTVNPVTTTVTLASSPNPSAYGSPVTFTATVIPATATGTVIFTDGTTSLGTATLSGGVATYSTSTLTAGSHSITASYDGDANDNSSTSLVLTQTVTLATQLNTGRYQHSATLLNNGTILVAGGVSCPAGSSCTYLNSGELYNPASGTSTNTGSLATPRSAPAVLLPNGSVLLAGGASCDSSGSCSSLNSAEVYNPASGTFASAGNMNVARDGHTMTLLSDGTVLIAGGETCSVSYGNTSQDRPSREPLYHGAHLVYASFTPVTGSISCSAQDSAEIYDPVAGSFTYTNGSLNVARYNAAATRLVNGQVLIAGGSNEFNALSSAEIYDPSAGRFTQTTGSLQTARTLPTATLLNNGLVLIAGGSTCDPLTCPTNTTELYDAATNAFQSTTGAMNVARVGQTATLLTNGQVVLTGGNSSCQTNPCTTESSTEIYDPTASTFSVSRSMTTARTGHTATLLSDGSVLLVGGFANGATLSSIELYQPSSFTPSGLVSIAVTPGSSSIGVGDAEQFAATGTFSNGSTETLESVVWTSSNAAVGSINNAASSLGFAFGVGAGSTTITATVGTISGSATLSIQLPNVSTVNPNNGVFGTQVAISGTNFGSEQASGSVTIGGAAASVLSWTNTSIVVSLPSNANPGAVPVIVNTAEGTNSNSASFTVIPSIASFAPSIGPVGTTVTMSGANFGTSGVVTFDGIAAMILSWSSTSLSVVVPTGASAGNVVVTSNSESSNTAVFTVLPTPSIAGLSTSSGAVGTLVTITGTNFGSSQGTVTFNGTVATPTSWSAGSIVVPVPAVATSGNVVITVSGVPSNGVNFMVVPTITSLSPTSGTVGTLVVIAGTGFGPNLVTGAVTFNGTAVTPISWSITSITAPVPPGATTGNVAVTVGGVSSNGANFTVQASGFVAATGQMTFARNGQTATQLSTGQVLVTGGMNSSGVLTSAELYTPSSQTFASAGTMNVARWLHTATQLNDGTVLIAGGSDLANEETLDTAEIYSPTTGTFTLLTSTLNTARVAHTATLLDNGQVLIVGGYDPDYGLIADAELYDPPSQTFIDLGYTNSPRYGHTATVLQNGQVLIAGGETDAIPSGAFNTAEIFNLTNETFTPVPAPMNASREGHAAVLLNNGQVLITGGDNPPNGSLSSAEVYDPPTSTFIAVPSAMTAPRISHMMTVLNGGKVLIAGGSTDSNAGSVALNSAELYDPTTQSFVAVGNMTSVREHQTATLLNDGTVLEDGGTDGTNIFNTADIYTSSRLSGLTSIAITPSAPSIGTGAQQTFTAAGTFSDGSTQTLASVLWSSSAATTAPISGDATNPGVAVGTTQGTTTITASAAGVSGSATLTVTAPTLVSITLSPQDATIPAGATQQFTATGVYSDGSTQDLTSTTTWSSPPSVVIAINNTGIAAGLFQGTATIQASSGSVNASTTVTVAAPAIVSIAVSPSTAMLAQGSSQQYQAIGTYSDGSTQNVTTLLSWSSGTPTVAAVGNTGLAVGVSQGTATLTGAYENISASSTLTVTAPTLVSITVAPNSASLSTGNSQQLIATGTYTDGSTQNLTASSTWVSSNSSVVSITSAGLATAVATGNVTVTATSGSVSGTAAFFVTTGTTLANLNTSRYQHSATILNNGQILVTGGINCSSAGACTYLSSAELYNPNTSSFANTGAMATARSAPAVLLNNGTVLTAGGYACDGSGNCSSLSGAEIYNPVAGTFNSAGTMTTPRSGHTMTVLSNGTVLIAGGENCTSAASWSCTVLSTAEIYDPNAGTFTSAFSSMITPRYGASAVLLNSGSVLIVGGISGSNLAAVAEIYNGASFASSGSNLNTPRFAPSATLLNNGKVLVAGGSTCGLPGCPTNAAEIYDPVANTFTLISGGMTAARFDHSATLLTNGAVYLAGGYSSCASTCTEEASTEVFDPVAGAFSASQSLTTDLVGHTGTAVANGNVLLIGGINAGVTQAADEWYQPASSTPPGLVSIAVAPANPFLVLGQTQQLVATGTFNDGSTETLQSVIWTSSNPSIAVVSNSPGSAGIVNAQTTGATTLAATAGNISGTAALNVAGLASLSISPVNPTMTVGSAQQFTATGTFVDNRVQDVTSYVTWSTSNISTLLISNASTGLPGVALGANPGTATISASLGSVQITTSVTVQPAPAASAPPVISAVSPTSGTAGTQVTITGSAFGSTQGSGSVWLGCTFGTVVSWSNTQIVATVAPIATSGVAQVQQNGLSSNTVPFSVSTAAISSVSPTIGVPGTQVTIAGSGFGATQGSGQVWLGTANAVVQSWSDSQVVAIVAIGSTSGSAQVLQNGVISNSVPFAINSLHINSVTPNSGAPGTAVTITGAGFGSSQGNSTLLIGGTTGEVMGWSNTQIVAAVAPDALTGVVRIEQNGVWSNAVSFTVPNPGSTVASLAPNMLTLAVGQTQTIQALNASGQPVTGLTWTSSNPKVVSLSTDDPPILTALAAGHVTITAGGASGDVTVVNDAVLPTGTVIWSNPGDGSGVTSIVPAVPSATGVADVFAFQADGTVQAVTSAGRTAWTANATATTSVADFLGGLVVTNLTATPPSITKLDGMTGAADGTYTAQNQNDTLSMPAVHTDGTIFTIDTNNSVGGTAAVVGIDPTTGNERFRVNIDQSESKSSCSGNSCSPISNYDNLSVPSVLTPLMIAGDGYAYAAYQQTKSVFVDQENVASCDPSAYGEYAISCATVTSAWGSETQTYLKLLRVGSDGASSKMDMQVGKSTVEGSGWATYVTFCPPSLLSGCLSAVGVAGSGQSATSGYSPGFSVPTPITNSDSGIVLTWEEDAPSGPVYHVATTTGSGLSTSTTESVPGQVGPITPVLQAQDGAFFGTVGTGQPGQVTQNMISFSSSGRVFFVIPNDSPKIATADGGVIGTSGMKYDSNGNVTGQSGNANPNTSSVIAVARANGAVQAGDTSTPRPAAQSTEDSGGIANSLTAAQSWVSNVYQTVTGQVAQLSVPPVPVATPPNWSFNGANQSGNSTSPRCHDDRDDLIYQYQAYDVRDSYFSKPYPLFRPNCFEETNTAHSANFSFAELNTNSGSNYALIKNPLVAPASTGYGLDAWVADFGFSRTINSAYRSPAHNNAVGGAAASRHMLGDAVDLQNETCPSSKQPCSDAGLQEWVQMVTAAGGIEKNDNSVNVNNTGAKASFVEPRSGPCGLNCTHADWRYKDRNKYAH
jgi:hypothetical protein